MECIWEQKKPLIMYEEYDTIVEKISKIRGITDINRFMNPTSKELENMYEMKNIEESISILVESTNVLVFADIDLDGATATAIMYHYLTKIGKDVEIRHSQRSKGHGIKNMSLDGLEKFDTLLILDSSSDSRSIEEFEKIKKLNKEIKILVVDHHPIEEPNKNRQAVILNCQDGQYKNIHLSGSAMSYKLCKCLDEELGVDIADEYLDLCAIGLIGDMMDVSSLENRYLINQGLNNIRNIGILSVLDESKVDYKYKELDSLSISFKIAPAISAVTRYDKYELAIELLTTHDEKIAKSIAKEMIKLNEKRKVEQAEHVDNIIKDVDASNNIIIVDSSNIDSGFRGLVATEIVNKFGKPCFVVNNMSGMYHGSARSVGNFDLKQFCLDTNLFMFATGHAMAHGVGFYEKNLDRIVSRFNTQLNKDSFKTTIYYDLEIHVDDIDLFDLKELEKISRVVGTGFPQPIFKVVGLEVEEQETKKLGSHVRAIMGKSNETVKINCTDFSLMKFRSNSEYAKDVEEHYEENFEATLEAIGTLNLNAFYNFGLKKLVTTKQMFLQDYKIIK